MKRIKLIILCLLLSLTLFGCQKNTSKSYGNVIYNSSIYDIFVDGNNYIYGSTSNEKGFNTIIQNKATGKVESFIRDPFFDDKKNNSYVEQIRIDNKNNKGYYMDTSETDDEKGFSIIQFDTNTFDKKEIYRENFIWKKEIFLGLNKISDLKASKENDFSEKRTSNMINVGVRPKYFVDGENLYLIRKNGVFRINIKSKKQTQLIKADEIKSVSFDGENIYYIDSFYDMYKYFIKTGKSVKLTANKSSYSIIAKNKIIYTNLNDENAIYIMNKDGSDNHKIENDKARNLNYDDKYIYYSNDNDNQCLYRIKYDGSENKKMTDVPAYFVFTFKNYNKVYIWSNDMNTNKIKTFSVNKKNFAIQLLDF